MIPEGEDRMEHNMTAFIAEAKKGNQAAYESLYQETKQVVYFTCFGLLKSEADAADQMQETYITAFQKLDMLEEPEKFPGWIKRIAINKCKDFLIRKNRWFPLAEEADIPVEVPETKDDFLPESYITVQSKREIVQQIMREELSEVQYRTVLMYYYDELSLTEIAEWMECSEGTVKSRLHTARERIREGVLRYEQKHDDKLYSIAALPFLARLLQMEAEELQAPEFRPDYLQGIKEQKPISRSNAGGDAGRKKGKGKTGMEKKGFLSTLTGKIIVAVLVLLIVGGGIAGILTAISHGGQKKDGQDHDGQEPGINAGAGEADGTVESKEEDSICQVPFTDTETGEDYLSGHIRSIRFFEYDDDDSTPTYLLLDDQHNLYKCHAPSELYYESEEEVQWEIELLYENTGLERIEDCWRTEHYNIYTGDEEPGEDGHEECIVIYGNGYLYRDGEEYDLNAIVPIKKLSHLSGWKDEIYIVDTSGNLHYWNNGKGLDFLNSIYTDYEQTGFLNYYEVPVCEELRQGNCVDVAGDKVLLSDGKLIWADSPWNLSERNLMELDVDAYTYEERIVMEGVQYLHDGGSGMRMTIADAEGSIHVGGLYFTGGTKERRDEIVDCDYEGEILDIYEDDLHSLLLHTTNGYYYSSYCHDITYEPEPFKELTVLTSTPAPIKEIVEKMNGIKSYEFIFLLEDGTVWEYVEGSAETV